MRYLLLEERQHSWHSRPCSPGMEPWMGMEQEAVVQEDQGHVQWDPRCRITHPPGSSFLCPWLTGPSQGCAVVSLRQDIARPFLCLSKDLGPELFRQWKTEDLGQRCHRVSLPLTCCALFAGSLLCVSFQILIFWPNPQGPASSPAGL